MDPTGAFPYAWLRGPGLDQLLVSDQLPARIQGTHIGALRPVLAGSLQIHSWAGLHWKREMGTVLFIFIRSMRNNKAEMDSIHADWDWTPVE